MNKPTAEQRIELIKWGVIPDYEGYYEVSNTGVVRSFDRVIKRSNGRSMTVNGKITPQHKDNNGYLKVTLCRDGKRKTFRVHQLVLLAFIGPANGLVIDHIDRNNQNNNLDNLRYCTQSENMGNAHWESNGHKYIGVEKHRRKYKASMGGGYIGIYDSEKEAAMAFDVEKIKKYGNKTVTNKSIGLL